MINYATYEQIKKIIELIKDNFDGFLVKQSILMGSGLEGIEMVTHKARDIEKPIIADMKLAEESIEDINTQLEVLFTHELNGVTVSGFLENEVIIEYVKKSRSFRGFQLLVYLTRTDAYDKFSLTKKIKDLEYIGVDGIILSFSLFSEINKVKKLSKETNKPIYLAIDYYESILVKLS